LLVQEMVAQILMSYVQEFVFTIPVISCRRHFVFRLPMCPSFTKRLWTRYLTNCLWEFHWICTLCTVGDKDELVRF